MAIANKTRGGVSPPLVIYSISNTYVKSVTGSYGFQSSVSGALGLPYLAKLVQASVILSAKA